MSAWRNKTQAVIGRRCWNDPAYPGCRLKLSAALILFVRWVILLLVILMVFPKNWSIGILLAAIGGTLFGLAMRKQ